MYFPDGGRTHPTHLVCLRHWFSGSDDVPPATFHLPKIRTPFADPKYSADHGPLPHISAGCMNRPSDRLTWLYDSLTGPNPRRCRKGDSLPRIGLCYYYSSSSS